MLADLVGAGEILVFLRLGALSHQGIDFLVAQPVFARVLVLEPGGGVLGEQAQQVGGGQQFGLQGRFVGQLGLVQLAGNGVQGADRFGGVQVILEGCQHRVVVRQLVAGLRLHGFATAEQGVVERIQPLLRILQYVGGEVQR